MVCELLEIVSKFCVHYRYLCLFVFVKRPFNTLDFEMCPCSYPRPGASSSPRSPKHVSMAWKQELTDSSYFSTCPDRNTEPLAVFPTHTKLRLNFETALLSGAFTWPGLEAPGQWVMSSISLSLKVIMF